ncbi:MAG: amidohydrolase family protein [Acidobacteriaceae bacterium]
MRNSRAVAAAGVMVWLAAGVAQAQTSFAVEHVRVFDGHAVQPNVTVVVADGKIAAIGKNAKTPDGVPRIGGSGKTLLPRLIDAHAHVWNADQLEQSEAFGVTTVLDMFTDWHAAQAMKADLTAGKLPYAADLRSAGTLATAPGGHGTEYGFKIPTISSPTEAQAWVDARIAEGSDYIKIVVDDGSTYGAHIPTITTETLTALVKAAHARGKLAVVHVGTLAGAEAALNANADGLMHLFVDREPDPGFGRLAAQHHAFVVPTLSVLSSIGGMATGKPLAEQASFQPYLTASGRKNLDTTFHLRKAVDVNAATAAIHQLLAAEVPILAGTDAPNPGTDYGISLQSKIGLLAKAGLTPIQALTAATAAPAKAFRLDDRGQIAVGQRADLLLVEGDPTTDIAQTRQIVSVWKAGVQDDRSVYAAKVKNADKAAAAEAQTAAATTPKVTPGPVSDFDDASGQAQFGKARFGAGWSPSTDQMMGGKSTVALEVIDGGANGSPKALRVAGEISDSTPYPWAGAMFSPGPAPFAPANLSAAPVLVFWTKGDNKPHRVLCFTKAAGRIPASVPFTPTAGWTEIRLPLSSFNGTEGQDVQAILFDGGTTPGPFSFAIDQISLAAAK